MHGRHKTDKVADRSFAMFVQAWVLHGYISFIAALWLRFASRCCFGVRPPSPNQNRTGKALSSSARLKSPPVRQTRSFASTHRGLVPPIQLAALQTQV